MKIKHWVKISILSILVLLFPLLLNLLCKVSVKISELLRIPQAIQFGSLSTIEFSDYATIIISLFPGLSVFWIGYKTYQLSESVREYSMKQDQANRQYALTKLLSELNNNICILENHINKMGSEPAKIKTEGYSLVEKNHLELSENDLTELCDLYRTFEHYKATGEIEDGDRTRFFSGKGIRSMELVRKLMNKGIS